MKFVGHHKLFSFYNNFRGASVQNRVNHVLKSLSYLFSFQGKGKDWFIWFVLCFALVPYISSMQQSLCFQCTQNVHNFK